MESEPPLFYNKVFNTKLYNAIEYLCQHIEPVQRQNSQLIRSSLFKVSKSQSIRKNKNKLIKQYHHTS